MSKIKGTVETATMRRDFLKEQIELEEAKVEVAEGTLIGMAAGLCLLVIVLIGIAFFL